MFQERGVSQWCHRSPLVSIYLELPIGFEIMRIIWNPDKRCLGFSGRNETIREESREREEQSGDGDIDNLFEEFYCKSKREMG